MTPFLSKREGRKTDVRENCTALLETGDFFSQRVFAIEARDFLDFG